MPESQRTEPSGRTGPQRTGPQGTGPHDGGPDGGAAAPARRMRPAPLLFEPSQAPEDPEHFFDLESIDDPGALLDRATELTVAFRAATDRSIEFQAMAAAQLADPRRFDRLPAAVIAERAEWTEDYAKKMIEFGRDLLRGVRTPD